MPEQRARSRARIPTLIAAALTALAPSAASAQERLHFEEFADQELYDLTLQRHNGDHESGRLLLYGGAEGSTIRGNAPSPSRPLSAFAGLGVGLWSGPMRSFQLRSDLLVPIPVGERRGGPALQWSDLEGSHRLHGLLGIGGVDKGQSGADFEVDGSMVHAGLYSTSFLRRDIGNAPFWDAAGQATIFPRLASGGHVALTAPVSYSLRRVHYDGALGPGSFTSQRISSGFGLRPYEDDIARGWFEFVGVAWEKTRFDLPRLAAGTRLEELERLDLRFLHLDGLIGSPESDMTINLSTFLGGSWLWDPTTHQDLSAFTFGVAGAIRGELDRHDEDTLTVGFAASRRAGFLADGSALTRRWRIEGHAGLDMLHNRTGGSIRVAFEHLSLPLAAQTRPEIGFQHAITTEWFFAFVPALHFGVHHASTDRCMATPPADRGAWCHQLGAFLRVGERWSEKAKGDDDDDARPRIVDEPSAGPIID